MSTTPIILHESCFFADREPTVRDLRTQRSEEQDRLRWYVYDLIEAQKDLALLESGFKSSDNRELLNAKKQVEDAQTKAIISKIKKEKIENTILAEHLKLRYTPIFTHIINNSPEFASMPPGILNICLSYVADVPTLASG